jgi:hypothetical protein
VATSCSTKDNSADTDRASEELRKAQSAVSTKRDDVTTTGDEIERRKRELVMEQQQLAAQEKSLENNQRQLGSARGTLEQARTAICGRTSIMRSMPASRASTHRTRPRGRTCGLRARRTCRDRAARMPDGSTRWAAYTKDVDTTFGDRDLRAPSVICHDRARA